MEESQTPAHPGLSDRLEADTRTKLDQTRTLSRRDLAVIPRGQICRWRHEADHVERVSGIGAELQADSTFKAEVARDPQIDVPVTWRSQVVARRSPVR